jgi:hypothetical protein
LVEENDEEIRGFESDLLQQLGLVKRNATLLGQSGGVCVKKSTHSSGSFERN